MSKLWAFLVGVNRYTDPAISGLQFCVNDVKVLGETLAKLGYVVNCLHDELDRLSPNYPTRDNVEARLIEFCRNLDTDDLLWVHFSCHGAIVERELNKESVLILHDTQKTLLKKRALPVTEVEKIMKGSGANKLLMTLDACHSGVEMGRDLLDNQEFIKYVYDNAEGFAVIAGSTSQQKAFELTDKNHGVFTYYLLQGLTGKAIESDKKNFVTVDDLRKYLLYNLKVWGIKNAITQEPTARTEVLGDIVIADYRLYPKVQMPEAKETGIEVGRVIMRDESANNSVSNSVLDVGAIEREELTEELESLKQEYQVTKKQARSSISNRDRLLLEKQAENILQQMKETEAKLKTLG